MDGVGRWGLGAGGSWKRKRLDRLSTYKQFQRRRRGNPKMLCVQSVRPSSAREWACRVRLSSRSQASLSQSHSSICCTMLTRERSLALGERYYEILIMFFIFTAVIRYSCSESSRSDPWSKRLRTGGCLQVYCCPSSLGRRVCWQPTSIFWRPFSLLSACPSCKLIFWLLCS